jgi:hypothetical protein
MYAQLVKASKTARRPLTAEEVRRIADFKSPGPIARLTEALADATDPEIVAGAFDPDALSLHWIDRPWDEKMRAVSILAGQCGALDAYGTAEALRRIADALKAPAR